MKEESFMNNYIDLVSAIELCIRERLIVPALVLIYSGIDAFAWLVSDSEWATRDTFRKWVKEWMLNNKHLPCNEDDLYAARCGILHTLISESDMSQKKQAKQIYYAWGEKNYQELQKTIYLMNRADICVAIQIEELFWTFRSAIADCHENIIKNPVLLERFKARSKKLFINESFGNFMNLKSKK
ncbi:MAG: hypothetical protein HYY40_12560 [Bacteroidetes bacterium]|nr:hypothetical protein [Bacteroidota bacterium]